MTDETKYGKVIEVPRWMIDAHNAQLRAISGVEAGSYTQPQYTPDELKAIREYVRKDPAEEYAQAAFEAGRRFAENRESAIIEAILCHPHPSN